MPRRCSRTPLSGRPRSSWCWPISASCTARSGDRLAGHHATDRVHLGVALRLHRPGHLRVQQPGRRRRDTSTWSTTGSRRQRCSCSPASWSPGAVRADHGLRRAGKVAPWLAGLFLRRRLLHAGAAGAVAVRDRVPRSRRARSCTGRGPLPSHVPASSLPHLRAPGWISALINGPCGAGARRRATSTPASASPVAPPLALHLVLGMYPKPLLTVIDPAVHSTITQVGEATTRQPSVP